MQKVNTSFDEYLPLASEKDDLTGRRVLLRPFKILVEGSMIVVPKGFDTDFSSYPWFTRVLVRFDRVDVAGVVHDYLYREGNRTRAEADRVWRLIAEHGERSANKVQSWLSWAGIRAGGWVAWQKHRKLK